MKRKNIILAFSFLIPVVSVSAQTATEAYRLSISDPLGTARNLGTGNSMFAIGPDFSAIGSNPAGIGGYWKSEFTITMGGQFTNYTSAFTEDRNNITDANYSIFTLPNVGFVLSSRSRNSRWKTSNWAVGYNRMAEYRRELNYNGSTLGSITDSWKENAFGLAPEELNGFEEGLAYTSGLFMILKKTGFTKPTMAFIRNTNSSNWRIQPWKEENQSYSLGMGQTMTTRSFSEQLSTCPL